VTGQAFDLDGEAIAAPDDRDHADRQTFGFEHRTLLDVKLGVREHVGALACGVAGALGVESECRQCVAHRHSIAVAAVEELPIERAGDRRGCRGAWSRNARLPRRRIPRPRSRTAAACPRAWRV
jgi:hypothetical protein